MATTTNYGWTTPDDTALVKDGASAIRTLGSSIDTSLNTALGTKKAGLVLLNTTSFSGVANQSINDVFSATYDNYKILIHDFIISTANDDIFLRMRVGGSDLTGSVYAYEFAQQDGGTNSVSRGTSQTRALIGSAATGDKNVIAIDIYNPFATKTTLMSATGICTINTIRQTQVSNVVGNTTSYTGFTILPNSNNLSGIISVYGYNK